MFIPIIFRVVGLSLALVALTVGCIFLTRKRTPPPSSSSSPSPTVNMMTDSSSSSASASSSPDMNSSSPFSSSPTSPSVATPQSTVSPLDICMDPNYQPNQDTSFPNTTFYSVDSPLTQCSQVCANNISNPYGPCTGFVLSPSPSPSTGQSCVLTTQSEKNVNSIVSMNPNQVTVCSSQLAPLLPLFQGSTSPSNGVGQPMGNGFFMYASTTLGNSNYPYQSPCSGWAASAQFKDASAIYLTSPISPFLSIVSKYQGSGVVTIGSQTISGEWYSIVFPTNSNCFLYEISFTGCLQNTTNGGLGLPYTLYCVNTPSTVISSTTSPNTLQCPNSNTTIIGSFLNGPSEIFLPTTFQGGKWGYGSCTVTFQLPSLQGPLQQLVIIIPSIVSGNTNAQLQIYASTLIGINGVSSAPTAITNTTTTFCV